MADRWHWLFTGRTAKLGAQFNRISIAGRNSKPVHNHIIMHINWYALKLQSPIAPRLHSTNCNPIAIRENTINCNRMKCNSIAVFQNTIITQSVRSQSNPREPLRLTPCTSNQSTYDSVRDLPVKERLGAIGKMWKAEKAKAEKK